MENALTVVFLVLLFPLLPLPLASTQTTYYVRPTSDSPCHHEDCLTLSEYASETSRYFNSDNLTLVFLPGEHTLNTSIDFQMFGSLTLLGNLSSLPNITSKIVCNETAALSLEYISKVEIKALAFVSCGIQGNFTNSYNIPVTTHFYDVVQLTYVISAISTLLIPSFHLVSCYMEYNYLPLLLNDSRVYLRDNKFESNNGGVGGAVAAFDSTVVFLGQNLFLGNDAVVGGGVFANRSELVFRGTTAFINNTAKYGGGIGARGSIITYGNTANTSMNPAGFNISCNRTHESTVFVQNLAQFTVTTFLGNSATENGGAVYSFNSQLRFGTRVPTGVPIIASQQKSPFCPPDIQSHFRNNSARFNGGAIAAYLSAIEFSGNTKFEQNSARECGGGIVTIESTFMFTGGTTFKNNSGSSGGGICASSSQLHFKERTKFTGNHARWHGGGIKAAESTLAFSEEIDFFSNEAHLSNGGGIELRYGTLSISGNATYISNTASGHGGVIHASDSTLNISGNAIYINNTAGGYGGVIMAQSSDIVLDGENTMTWNSATYEGGAIRVAYSTLTITGVSDFVENWANENGGALYAETSNLIFSGVNRFFSNVATSGHGYGGAIHAVTTLITLSGIHNLTNNSAIYGGGLAITSYDTERYLYLTPNASVSFLDNYAQKHGGAIFVEHPLDHYCGPDVTALLKTCFFSFNKIFTADPSFEYTFFKDRCSETDTYMNKCLCHILIEGNFAEDGGDTIYGGNLHNCIVLLTAEHSCKYYDDYILVGQTCYTNGLEAVAALTQTPVEQLTRDPLNVASYTYKVCTCDSRKPNCKQRIINHTAYPGETVFIPLVTVGEHGIVPAAINAENTESEGARLGHLQHTQAANLSCTFLGYTLLTSGTRPAKLILSTKGPCGEPGIPLYVNLNFLPCPFGFVLSQFGSCGCGRRLQKYTNSCDINSRTFTRNSDFWLGFDDHSHGLILHPHCPFDYCKLGTVSFTRNSTDLQCAHRRSGTLCGACKSGLSLNLGSSQCSPCSNVFLLLFLPFAIAGYLLVIFLFIFKVTIAAGTTSGLIFYANVVAVNRSVFFPSGETNILTVFIAWLNLDLGIETCFIDGMDVYTRTWLQFVFPLYIWLLVGIITLVSYYSMTVARIIGPTNPVSVLATLFLLSYTKFIRAIIATFSFTSLDYPNHRSVTVWVYDGTIGYFEGKHIPLFLAGLLAFLLLFLPYTLLLLFGQCIEAGSNHKLLSWANNLKVRSFLDAYHAPYKNRHRYWTGLLLLLRFILFIISAVIDINSPRDPSINFLVLGITCLGLTVWVWNTGSMYKKWYNNVLESTFILNLGVLALASYQVKVEGGNQAAVVYTSVSIAFVTFLGIIAYHVEERVKDSRMWRNSIGPKLQHLKKSLTNRQQHQDPIEMAVPPTAPPPPVTTTFVDLREPLLESLH